MIKSGMKRKAETTLTTRDAKAHNAGMEGSASGSGASRRTFSAKMRIVALFILLGSMALFAGYRWFRSQAISRIANSLANHENLRAIDEIRSLEMRFGKDAETCLLAARAYRRLGKQSLFERSLDQSEQLGADSQVVRHERLLSESQHGQLPNLVARIDELLAGHESDFEDTASSVMYGLLARQELEPASKLLMAWQGASPDSPGVSLFRGMIAIWQRDWKRAKEILEPAVQSHPDYVPYYMQLGIAYSGLNENEEATKAFERYRTSLPDNANAALKHAVVLKKLGRTSEALDVLLRVLQSGQSSTDILLQAGMLHIESNHGREALELLAEPARLWPEDVPIASALSQAYAQVEDEQAAARFAQVAEEGRKAIEGVDAKFFALIGKPQRTAQECYELGHVLLHKQSRENGIFWLEAALQLDEHHLPSHRDMALFYERTNQPQLAAVHHRYLAKQSSNP